MQSMRESEGRLQSDAPSDEDDQTVPLPLTHFVRATRSVLLKGEGVSAVVSEMLPVALFALAAAAFALLAYRRHLD
jgi:hypothetical protein